MTVAELVTKLRTFPPGMTVGILDGLGVVDLTAADVTVARVRQDPDAPAVETVVIGL